MHKEHTLTVAVGTCRGTEFSRKAKNLQFHVKCDF